MYCMFIVIISQQPLPPGPDRDAPVLNTEQVADEERGAGVHVGLLIVPLMVPAGVLLRRME